MGCHFVDYLDVSIRKDDKWKTKIFMYRERALNDCTVLNIITKKKKEELEPKKTDMNIDTFLLWILKINDLSLIRTCFNY